MEEFDFNVPINATVIYDDSDNEITPDIEIIKDSTKISTSESDVSKKQESHVSNEFHDKEPVIKIKISKANNRTEFKIIRSNEIQNEAPGNIESIHRVNKLRTVRHPIKNKNRKSKKKALDMPSLEDNLNNLEHSSIVDQANTKASNTNRQVSKKRRNSICVKSKPKRRLTKNINPNVHTNVVDEFDHIKICQNQNCSPGTDKSVTNTNISSSEDGHTYINAQSDLNIHLSNLNNSNDQTVAYRASNNEINISSVQKQNQPVTNIISPEMQNIIDESTTNDIKGNLKTVSEYMIFIMNSLQSISRISKTTNESLIEQARNNYIHTKAHFFMLSYNSVLNIILPREEDYCFVQNFFDDTVKLANSRYYPYSYRDIVPLFYEMIEWVKRKQRHIQNKGFNKMSNQALIQQLNKPINDRHTKPPSPYSYQKQVQTRQMKTCGVYSQGPPERTLNTLQRNPNIHNEQILPCDCPVVMPSRNIHNCYYNSQVHNTQTNKKTTNIFSDSTVHEDTANIQKIWEGSETTMQKQNTLMPKYTISNPLNTLTKHHAPMQAAQSRDNFWEYKATRAWEKRAPQSWDSQAIQPCGDELVTQVFEKEALQLGQLPLIQLDNIAEITQYLNLEPPSQAQTEPNRSLSRDSGFMSPLNFNCSSDQTYNTRTQEPETQPTPFITHVTSLNPNVSYITEGFCTVCGKTTKMKCLGCYKYYYCNPKCQNFDWNNHMAVCKMQ